MKSVEELMRELGFNKDANDSVKRAFIKHLIFAATGKNIDRIDSSLALPVEEISGEHQQLSLFDKKVV